jgi:hypothetical protein
MAIKMCRIRHKDLKQLVGSKSLHPHTARWPGIVLGRHMAAPGFKVRTKPKQHTYWFKAALSSSEGKPCFKQEYCKIKNACLKRVFGMNKKR